MPTWMIDGADEKTGKDHSVTVTANSQEEAVKQARAKGVFPSAVKMHTGPTVMQAPPSNVSPTESLPRPSIPSAPNYRMLLVLAWLLTIFGLLCLVIGIAGLFALLLSGHFTTDSDTQIRIGELTISGFITSGMGEGLKAVRDMARNSFRM